MNNIKWIKEALVENKEDHKEMLERLDRMNGTIDDNRNKVTQIEQIQKDHFILHEKLDKISRSTAVMIIAIIQIIAMVIIKLI